MRTARPARVFDAEGRPVLITMTCPQCRKTKPLSAFGLRRMGNGQIRNCPWCKACRSAPRLHLVVGTAQEVEGP